MGMCGMGFGPSKRTVLLQDWIESNPNLVLAEQQMNDADRFSYLGSST